MKPIVLIFGGNHHNTIVVTPKTPESHTEASWDAVQKIIIRTCEEKIREGSTLIPGAAIEMVVKNAHWKCAATNGISIATWMIVE